MVDPAPPIYHRAIYHLCTLSEWRAAEAEGVYNGSSQDAADGFIHFSTAAQVVTSAAKHRAGQAGLVLLSVDPAPLGEALKWEEARSGDPFPHLYGPLPVTAVSAAVRQQILEPPPAATAVMPVTTVRSRWTTAVTSTAVLRGL